MERCRFFPIAIVVLFALSNQSYAHEHPHFNLHFGPFNDDVDIHFKNDSIILELEEENDFHTIAFSKNEELFIDGEKIKTDREQKKLIHTLYDGAFEVKAKAKDIGIEGAKIGVTGAKIGLKAVASVIRLLSPSYDSDDLERDMENETKDIEKKAERIEREAEKLEKRVNELEEVFEELIDLTPELQKIFYGYI